MISFIFPIKSISKILICIFLVPLLVTFNSTLSTSDLTSIVLSLFVKLFSGNKKIESFSSSYLIGIKLKSNS
jgi:hypothetical protein